MSNLPDRKPLQARLAILRSVRAQTTLVAMGVVAVMLVVAVAGLAAAVERSLTDRLQAHGEALVADVVERLEKGSAPQDALEAALEGTSSSEVEVPTWVAVLDEEGHPVFGPGFFAMPGVADDGGVSTGGFPGGVPTIQVLAGGTNLTVAQRSIEIDGELLLVVAASPLAEVVRSVETVIGLARWGVPLLVLLVGAVTWAATGRTLRPIERIRTEVEELSTRTLDRRIPVPPSGDEVARLATTMNRMLSRLETASARQRQFVSDASHELRSPVATIRTDLEVALAHPDSQPWSDVATEVLQETNRIEGLVDDLLQLARSDEDAVAPRGDRVSVPQVVVEEAARVTRVPVEVHVNDAGDALFVRSQGSALASVVGNLLDNAAKHATATVRITAAAAGDAVVITVDDDGPGIPEADRHRVFERFARLDTARSRTAGGVGLGLAVVDRIVRDHDGTVRATEGPAGGARFVVTLPRA